MCVFLDHSCHQYGNTIIVQGHVYKICIFGKKSRSVCDVVSLGQIGKYRLPSISVFSLNIFNTSLQTLVQYHHLFQFSTHHWHWMMVDQGCSYDDRGSSFRDRGRSSFAAFALDLFLQSPSVKSLNTQF